jgi:hypothetical protein
MLITKNGQYFGRALSVSCIESNDQIDTKQFGGMFDLPSIMNTLLQKTYDMVKMKELEDDQKEEWMKYELDHFVQRLYKLVR